MPESDATPPAESSVKSTLEKPLHLLTEDDIAQLTREDCRRYLKEKGMRRPSWNKSQAIQQVIMLKKLLETTPDSDVSASRKRLRISRPSDSGDAVPESVPRGTCGGADNSVPPEATASYRRRDLDRPDSSHGFSGRLAAASDESAEPRPTGSTNMPVGQMTIFYCGKVNVYDDVLPDKAQALMHIAASPLEFSQEQPVDGMEMQPSSRLSKAVSTSIKACDSAAFVLPPMQRVKSIDNSQMLGEEVNMLREETPVEGPSRKASVQRYLEKRKDRFKSKRKEGMTPPASVEMYFNHQMCNQIPTRSDKCSPTQIRQPSTPTRCTSVDNDSIKNVCLSAFMNDKGL